MDVIGLVSIFAIVVIILALILLGLVVRRTCRQQRPSARK